MQFAARYGVMHFQKCSKGDLLILQRDVLMLMKFGVWCGEGINRNQKEQKKISGLILGDERVCETQRTSAIGKLIRRRLVSRHRRRTRSVYCQSVRR